MLPVALVVAALVFRAVEPVVVYTRGDGTPLPANVIREATHTARKHGGEPWVIVAHQLPGIAAWSLDLYVTPVQPMAVVRRGTLLSILAGDNRGRPRWSIVRTQTYAHVRVRSQHPYEVRSPSDPARPFAIDGELSDQDILSVVDFLRSRPRYRGEGNERTVDRLPIQSLAQTRDGQIRARLGVDFDSMQEVMVKRLPDGWTVTRISDGTR